VPPERRSTGFNFEQMGTTMNDWADVNRWRRERRAELLAGRQSRTINARSRAAADVARQIVEQELLGTSRTLGFYWPFKSELDLRPLLFDLVQEGVNAALPVVVEKNRPVEFWAWWPGMKLLRGIWNIPIPAKRYPVAPDALLVPLLGFDEAGYRLGYGGGYYDRTLAAVQPRPRTIGVGLESARLRTIHPQPHDIPMDAIVTEKRVMHFPGHNAKAVRQTGTAAPLDDEDPNARATYASPPCFMHEFE